MHFALVVLSIGTLPTSFMSILNSGIMVMAGQDLKVRALGFVSFRKDAPWIPRAPTVENLPRREGSSFLHRVRDVWDP